jgi:hypothetical protein
MDYCRLCVGDEWLHLLVSLLLVIMLDLVEVICRVRKVITWIEGEKVKRERKAEKKVFDAYFYTKKKIQLGNGFYCLVILNNVYLCNITLASHLTPFKCLIFFYSKSVISLFG